MIQTACRYTRGESGPSQRDARTCDNSGTDESYAVVKVTIRVANNGKAQAVYSHGKRTYIPMGCHILYPRSVRHLEILNKNVAVGTKAGRGVGSNS